MSLRTRSRNRAMVLIVFAIFALLWVLINEGKFFTASIIYGVMSVFLFLFYLNWNKFGKPSDLVGIDDNWVTDSFWGFLLAVGFIILGEISPFIGTIGIPQVQSIAETFGRFLIIVIVAPIMEELLFRDVILDFFDRKGVNFPFFVAALISSGLFSLYHLTAYGSSLIDAGGSFLSAGIAGMGFAYLRKYTNSNIGNIIAHATLNFYIGFVTLAVIVA